jgi:predicted RecB family nuclease
MAEAAASAAGHTRPGALSKTRFLAGLQCHKRLYWQVAAPELAAARDAALEFRLAQGQEVGRLAQRAFPGGVALDAGRDQLEAALVRTAALVADPAVPAIFEATFRHGGVLVRIDVLERTAPDRWRLLEVKSGASVKAWHVADVAIQRHIAVASGLAIDAVAVMHVRRDYVYAGGPVDARALFTCADVTPQAAELEADLPRLIAELHAVLAGDVAPAIAAGRQCRTPVHCEFFDRCNAPLPVDHVRHLPGLRGPRLEALLAQGIARVAELPPELELGSRQRLALTAIREGRTCVSAELAAALRPLASYPRAFMDFESLGPAIPRFPGMRPFDAIPFQWSVHVERAPGAPLEHREFLATDAADPRRRFLETLAEAVGDRGPIVVYSPFESDRLADLARWLPDLAPRAEAMRARLWDLLPVMRRHVYHPDFRGGFSLKRVLPVLAGLGYGELDVQGGSEAGALWDRVVRGEREPAERARLAEALRLYCGQDSLGLAALVRVLAERAGIPDDHRARGEDAP